MAKNHNICQCVSAHLQLYILSDSTLLMLLILINIVTANVVIIPRCSAGHWDWWMWMFSHSMYRVTIAQGTPPSVSQNRIIIYDV